MPPDETAENRLRRLLRDPRWSLPPWLDAEARVRRAARRQRIWAAGIGLGASAAVIAAIVVPLALLPGAQTRPGPSTGPGSSPSASSHPHPRRHPAYSLPPVGALGFPVSIYPPPPSHKVLNAVGVCPSPSGLRSPGPGIRAAALTVVDSLGRSFRSDLRLSDRVYWQQALTNWREGLGGPSGTVHVLYSGPLESYRSQFGPPDFSPTIRAGCGNRIARDTWMIVEGP
jgi:hypothetical protein